MKNFEMLERCKSEHRVLISRDNVIYDESFREIGKCRSLSKFSKEFLITHDDHRYHDGFDLLHMDVVKLVTKELIFCQYQSDGCTSSVILYKEGVINKEILRKIIPIDNVSAVVDLIDGVLSICDKKTVENAKRSLTEEQLLYYELNGNGGPGEIWTAQLL